MKQTWVALAVATFIEKPDGAFHSCLSSLVVELTSLTELDVTCQVSPPILQHIIVDKKYPLEEKNGCREIIIT